MNWIIASFIMFFGSVALYLVVRRSSLKQNPSQINNLAMFSVPLIVFTIIGLIRGSNFLLSPFHFLIIIVTGIFFSYFGNAMSLKSIEYAPNPGYSLVISKSYVVFTTLVAVFAFNAELTIQRAVAIIIIVLFSALIMTSNKVLDKKTNPKWLPLAIGAFFSWGMLSLISKYLLTNGVDLYAFLTYTYTVVSILVLIEMKSKNISFNFNNSNTKIFISIGIFSTIFNLFNFMAIDLAPNIGYVNAMNASSISLVTLASAYFFKDDLSTKKLIGVIGVTSGLTLLFI